MACIVTKSSQATLYVCVCMCVSTCVWNRHKNVLQQPAVKLYIFVLFCSCLVWPGTSPSRPQRTEGCRIVRNSYPWQNPKFSNRHILNSSRVAHIQHVAHLHLATIWAININHPGCKMLQMPSNCKWRRWSPGPEACTSGPKWLILWAQLQSMLPCPGWQLSFSYNYTNGGTEWC